MQGGDTTTAVRPLRLISPRGEKRTGTARRAARHSEAAPFTIDRLGKNPTRFPERKKV